MNALNVVLSMIPSTSSFMFWGFALLALALVWLEYLSLYRKGEKWGEIKNEERWLWMEVKCFSAFDIGIEDWYVEELASESVPFLDWEECLLAIAHVTILASCVKMTVAEIIEYQNEKMRQMQLVLKFQGLISSKNEERRLLAMLG